MHVSVLEARLFTILVTSTTVVRVAATLTVRITAAATASSLIVGLGRRRVAVRLGWSSLEVVGLLGLRCLPGLRRGA